MIEVEDHREFYNLYFKEFNRLAVGEYAHLSFGNDRPNDTCSSLESVIAYTNYIGKSKKTFRHTILNAGAGASSWMFRKLFDAKHVICADPNPEYLNLVKLICATNKLGSYRFQSDLFLYDRVDHVYYDYGAIERLPYLGAAIDNARLSIYVDDVDKRDCCKPYRDHVIALCASLNLKWFDCEESLDEYGRAGIIIEK